MGLLPSSSVNHGSVKFAGREILGLSAKQMRHLWGAEMSMVFQNPLNSFNPLMKIGKQITEPLRLHLDMDKATATATAVQLLRDVRIPEPERRLSQYPHELSGGMRQRVMISIALACGPTLLFADEPTTALDVTVQAQILDLIGEQRRDRNMSVILVTHDLGVVAGHTDQIAVMYGGKLVEYAPTKTLFADMKMPYTKSLMRSIPKLTSTQATAASPRFQAARRTLVNPPPGCNFAPRCLLRTTQSATSRNRRSTKAATTRRHDYACWYPVGYPRVREARRRIASDRIHERRHLGGLLMAGTGKAHLRDGDRVLSIEDLVVEFKVGRGNTVKAVSGISFDVLRGETLGIVGESGCGKSTTGRAIMQIPAPTSGSNRVRGPGPHDAQQQRRP